MPEVLFAMKCTEPVTLAAQSSFFLEKGKTRKFNSDYKARNAYYRKMFILASSGLILSLSQEISDSNLLGKMLDILFARKVLLDKWSKTVEMEELQFSSSHEITWKPVVAISRENHSVNNGVKGIRKKQE